MKTDRIAFKTNVQGGAMSISKNGANYSQQRDVNDFKLAMP